MIINSGIPAVLTFSLLTITIVLHSASHAIQILRNWDVKSGTELQVNLERKASLLTKVLFYLFGFQFISLFLFIYTADDICTMFSGAMCAVGSLAANSYGFPVLILKTLNFFLAGLWLILNHADNKAVDYPLTREKYTFLLLLVPLFLLETILQGLYFYGLHPHTMTSCCGSLYSQGSERLASAIPSLSSRQMIFAFYSCMLLTVATGISILRSGKGVYAFALMNGITFIVSMASIVSFISVYFYQIPTHHCPFCIFQKEHGYLGYLLYAFLFLGSVTGLGVGILQPYRKRANLRNVLPAMQRMLTAVSVVSLVFFMLIASIQIIFSSFHLDNG